MLDGDKNEKEITAVFFKAKHEMAVGVPALQSMQYEVRHAWCILKMCIQLCTCTPLSLLSPVCIPRYSTAVAPVYDG